MEDANKLLTKRNIIALVVLVLMVAAIPVGVYLAKQQQQLKSRADQGVTGTPIRFVTGSNLTCDSSGNCSTTSDTFELDLNSPLGPPASDSATAQ